MYTTIYFLPILLLIMEAFKSLVKRFRLDMDSKRKLLEVFEWGNERKF